MDDSKVEYLKHAVHPKSGERYRGNPEDGRGKRQALVASAQHFKRPEDLTIEIRDPVPEEDVSKTMIDSCLVPSHSMVTPCQISTKLSTPVIQKLVLPPTRSEDSVPKTTYEVIGEKITTNGAKKKLAKKRWPYLSFTKDQNSNVEKSATQQLPDTSLQKASRRHSRLGSPSHSRSRSRSHSRGRTTSPRSAVKRSVSPIKSRGRTSISSPDKVRKQNHFHDSSNGQLHRSPSPKRRSKSRDKMMRDGRNDQPSRPLSRERSTRGRSLERQSKRNERQKDIDPVSNGRKIASDKVAIQRDLDNKTSFQDPKSSGDAVSMAMHLDEIQKRDGELLIRPSTNKEIVEEDKRKNGNIASLIQVANLKEGDDISVASSTAPHSGLLNASPLNQVQGASRGVAICGTNNNATSPRGALRSCLKKNDSGVSPMSNEAKAINGEIIVEDFLKIDDTAKNAESPAVEARGIIASLVEAANLREGDVFSVASSNLPSVGSRSGTPFSESSDFSGSSARVMSNQGPFRGCLNRGVDPTKRDDNVNEENGRAVKQKVLPDITANEKEKDGLSSPVVPIRDPFYRDFSKAAGNKVTRLGQSMPASALKPPMHPVRSKVKQTKQNEVDDDASILSFDTQSSQRSTISLSKTKSFKSALKGIFSRKDSSGNKKDAADDEIETRGILQRSNSDQKPALSKESVLVFLSPEEQKCMNKIHTFIMEAADLLKEASKYLDSDATEVEIFASKAYAYANEAEKLAHTLTSSASLKDHVDPMALRSVPSASTYVSTSSFVHRLNHEEHIRRLERVSFMDFGHSGLQSLLCNGGGTMPLEQIRSLAFETIQILETFASNIKLPRRVVARIHTVTSEHAKSQWTNYGNQSIAAKAVCGGKNSIESTDRSSRRLFGRGGELVQLVALAAPTQDARKPKPLRRSLSAPSDMEYNEMSSLVADDNSLFMAAWARDRNNKSSRQPKIRFRGIHDDTDDNDTSCGSYTEGTSSVRDSTTDRAYSVSAASSGTSSVMKDFLDVIAYHYCDKLCGGPEVHTNSGDSVVELDDHSDWRE